MAQIKVQSIKDLNKVINGVNYYNLICDNEGISWQDGETLGTFDDVFGIICHRATVKRRIEGYNYIISYHKVIDGVEFVFEGTQSIRTGSFTGDELGTLIFSKDLIINTK